MKPTEANIAPVVTSGGVPVVHFQKIKKYADQI
jgi:hypothetical protein